MDESESKIRATAGFSLNLRESEARMQELGDTTLVVGANSIAPGAAAASESDSNQMLSVGSMLGGRYKIVSVIGEGGMGVIYKAHHLALDKVVAVKLLNRDRVDDQSMRRFHIEAQATSGLNHPNLITVHDLAFHENNPYLVMDFVQGISLADLIKEKYSLPVNQALDIGIQVCAGMSFAHERGILHRDLKPSNIMLTGIADGAMQVKIVDFGIAKIVGRDDDHALTRTGEIFGSPLYMSPEQAVGQRVNEQSDIYSLGCLLFEALTGQPPFVGNSFLETMVKRVQQEPPTLSDAAPMGLFPSSLEAVIKRALARELDRIESMEEFRQLLIAVRMGDRASNWSVALSPRTVKILGAFAGCVVLVVGAFWCMKYFATRNDSAQELSIAAAGQKPRAVLPPTPPQEPVLTDAERIHRLMQLQVNARTTDADLSSSNLHRSVDDTDILALSALRVMKLNLKHQTYIDDRGLEYISRLKGLQELYLKGAILHLSGSVQLPALRFLRKLDISQCNLVNEKCIHPVSNPHSCTARLIRESSYG